MQAVRSSLVPLLIAAACSAGPATRQPPAAPVAAYQPCAGKSCGEPCSLCPPGEADCSEEVGVKACDPGGSCRKVPFECEPPMVGPTTAPESDYVPCAGKRCGEPCNVCPPGATDCVETQVVKVCSPDARCVPAPATCDEPGDRAPPDHQ
jgi:hypothetical protein